MLLRHAKSMYFQDAQSQFRAITAMNTSSVSSVSIKSPKQRSRVTFKLFFPFNIFLVFKFSSDYIIFFQALDLAVLVPPLGVQEKESGRLRRSKTSSRVVSKRNSLFFFLILL